MKKFKRILSVVLVVVLLCSFGLTASAADYGDAANDPATSWITAAQESRMVYARPMFDDLPAVRGEDTAAGAFTELIDIITVDGKIYILDGARIVVLDEEYNFIKQYDAFMKGGEKLTFEGAKGIYVNGDTLYVCDTSHSRVIIADFEGNVKGLLTKPESEMWPNDLNFEPIKMVIDRMDYIYVLCDGSFYGAVMYTPKNEFKGFFGANVVSTSVLDAMNNLWQMLTTNNEKLSKTAKKLPYSFIDLVLGEDGYIYTCTGLTTRVSTSEAGSVKRLNPTGKNILVDKSKDTPTSSNGVFFTTRDTSKIKGYPHHHNVASIAVDKNNFFYVLDAPYGRIYMYDIECNLITTIGGGVTSGQQKGTFRNAVAISTMGDKIYAIDDTKKTIISFKINSYGELVQKVQSMTINGDYTDAKEMWKQVLDLDNNSIIAYRGLAKACLVDDEYDLAMEYAQKGFDRNTYSQAFEYVRKDFLERNFTWIFIGAIVLVVAIVLLLRWKKKSKFRLIKNEELRLALGTMLHPADTFYEIKRNNRGSVLIATGMLVVWYIFKIIGYGSSFIFNKTSIESANAWYALAQTFGLVLLFVVANWLVCVLFEGKGKLRQLYIAVCYSIMPLIIQAIGYDILSSVLTASEANFIAILNYICFIYTGILLVMAIINIQEYGLGRFILTTIATGIAMIFVIFLVFLVLILLQQSSDFVKTLFLEVAYR